MTKSYKEEFSLDQRSSESNRILAKYPDRVPIIIECKNKELNGLIHKKKFLVPSEISVSYLMQIIRGKSKLDCKKAIFMFIGDKILVGSSIISEVYEKYLETKKNTNEKYDKFLYIELTYENTFGVGNLGSPTTPPS